MSNSPSPNKAFFTRLQPGIQKKNLGTFYFIAFVTICLASLINMLQPFMLTEFLGLPKDQHGVPTGQLAFAGELVIIAFVGLFGILSDRTGRRNVYGIGLLFMGIGFAITPFSTTIEGLILTRCIYAIGVAGATAMLAIVVADYVMDEDRGKATGIMGFMNGLGAMISAMVLMKVPSWLTQSGMDAKTAGWYTYLGVAIFAVISAFVAWTMLSGKRPAKKDDAEKVPFIEGAKIGVKAAKDPGIKLSYAASFVARPDLAIVALFIPLWISKYGQEVLNLPVEEALAKAGVVLACCFGASLLFAPIIGIITDRINRVGALALALIINTVGYGLTFFITNPTGGMMMGVMVIIGMGQVSGVITSQVLIQQQAPAAQRGSIIGVFGLAGAVGILFCSALGGFLFDSYGPSGPFVLLAGLNGIVAIWGLAIMNKVKPPVEEILENTEEAPSETLVETSTAA